MKDTTYAMFREKAVAITPKKEDIIVNMVLVVTTYIQIPKNVVFKDNEPHKNKSLVNLAGGGKTSTFF
jgi:hypothetical protein